MIPMWYLLIPYGIFFFLGFLFLLFNLFHIAKFGLQSVRTTFVLASYVLSFVFIGMTSVLIVFSFDWDGDLEIGQIFQTNFTGQDILEL